MIDPDSRLNKLKAEMLFWSKLPAYDPETGKSRYDPDVPSDPLHLNIKRLESLMAALDAACGEGEKLKNDLDETEHLLRSKGMWR